MPSLPHVLPWAELGPSRMVLSALKPIVRETELIDAEGEPRLLIVAPAEAPYLDLAYALQEEIQGAVAGPTRVLLPEAAAAQRREGCNIIALGNIANNALLFELYHCYYVAVDHAYPGPGGHVLQTVCDPWGEGTNLIVCGGSDVAGVRRAVGRAIAALRREGRRTYLPYLHDISISGAFLERYPTVSFECTPAHRQELLELAYRRIEQGEHRRATPIVSHAGLMYHLTGDERFALAYRDTFKVMYHSAVNDPGTGPWSPWGFDADFQSAPMLGAWDVVEECPVLTDEDRLYITNHLLWYVQYMYEHARSHKPTRPSPRHNHYTFAALGLLLGAKYFGKYYRWKEAEEWLREADECFRPQALAFKANEDCNSYQWLTFYHTLRYALIRPDRTFIDSGMARLCLDLGIATMDNLGYQVPYGDVREWSGTFSEVPYYKAVAAVLRDPAYAPVLARKEQVRPRYGPGQAAGSFAPHGIQPVGYEYDIDIGEGRPLRRYFHVAALPVEPLYFQAFAGPEHIEESKAFDKIVFRHSLNPEDDYLLLDGLSNGGHLHYDGNAILRYTSKGRIWLADADYMQVPQKFHNTLLLFREGRGALIPPYMELGEATWLEPFGYARSTARGYAGCDWTRHILELAGQWYLVMDEARALEPGSYDARCLWRAVGSVQLRAEEGLLRVEQDGPTMELRCAPGISAPVTLVLKEEPEIWGAWEKYPYNGGRKTVQVLQERLSRRLNAGEHLAFFNLFGTKGPYPPLERLGERAVRLSLGSPAIAGAGEELAQLCGLETDAAFAYLSRGELLLAGVTRVAAGGTTVFEASCPVTLLLQLERAQAQICASCAGELVLGDGRRMHVEGGRQSFSLPPAPELQEAVAAALSAPCPAPAAARPPLVQRLGLAKAGSRLWRAHLPEGEVPTAMALGAQGELCVGTEGGTVWLVAGGELGWAFSCGGRVNALSIADVNGDGRPEVIVGSADHHVYLLDEAGRELWRHELPYYLHEPTVEAVMAVDFGPGRGRAVVAGSNNCHVHAFAPADGHELWRCEVIHGVNDLTSADMNEDGVPEVLAVTEWWTFQCIDATGKPLWPYWVVRPRYGPGANVVRAADVNGDGHLEMLVGAIDTCVYAWSGTGERLWEFFTGEEISALECLDVNGDGVPEVIAGSLNGCVYALNGNGQELWHVALEEEVQGLSVLGAAHGIAVAVAGPFVYFVAPAGKISAYLDCGSPVRLMKAGKAAQELGLYVASVDSSISAFAI